MINLLSVHSVNFILIIPQQLPAYNLFAAQDSPSSLGQLIDGPEQTFATGRLAPRLFLGALDCASIFSNPAAPIKTKPGRIG
jgi:hypothetical protein